jgi:formiminotetrahydrofolate cyclodeaminase
MYEYANKTATSDFGVGTLMLCSGLNGAVLNVKTNLSGFEDQKYKNDCLDECLTLLTLGNEIKNRILNAVENELN